MSNTRNGRPTQIIEAYFDWWMGVSGNQDIIADSIVMYDSSLPEGVLRGYDELDKYRHSLLSGFPDFQVTVEEVLSNEVYAMVEWTARATHKGWFKGLPPSNREVTLPGMSKIEIDDGKINVEHSHADYHHFRTQLGLTVPTFLGLVRDITRRQLREWG